MYKENIQFDIYRWLNFGSSKVWKGFFRAQRARRKAPNQPAARRLTLINTRGFLSVA